MCRSVTAAVLIDLLFVYFLALLLLYDVTNQSSFDNIRVSCGEFISTCKHKLLLTRNPFPFHCSHIKSSRSLIPSDLIHFVHLLWCFCLLLTGLAWRDKWIRTGWRRYYVAWKQSRLCGGARHSTRGWRETRKGDVTPTKTIAKN